MMMYKLFSFSFIFLTPIFAYILVNFFNLKRFGILFTDLSFPLFALEIALVVNKFLDSSVFFYYLICLSLLALSLTAFFLKKNHSFSYRRFGKFFWRSGFIVTFIFYIVVVILIFTMA
ncbi:MULTISPECIES: DUF3397 domain-containing protein [Streptococcus]|uniref:DUF3397 domain-containing protein n=1 Tax=Streptococcus TaxID=1301 RepID=UPI0005C6C545|nr:MULTISPECIES: DUF3397 domain-containing protein [Streptococcus]MCQ2962978.1 DUF3397 domain-containing protein [Streptococcus sp.]SUN57435.1 integral membrane protein [Streptococcus equinus]VEE23371.1 integral membrane protein [Streptococcus equinus]